jgi:hypothetical protein
MDDERPRLPGFAALLRDNLPDRPADYLAYAVIAFALRFFLNFSLAAVAVVTGITIPVSVVFFAAAQYAVSRFAARVPADGSAEDDDGR